jgi:hypothetical protein
MIMIRFLLCLLALMMIQGCGLFEFRSCDGDSGNYGKSIKIATYYSFSKYHLNTDEIFNSANNKTEYRSSYVYFKRQLELHNDSTFIYTRIWEHYSDSSHKEVVVDTMEYMSGSFRIRPVDGEKWNSFVLSSDSIFTRWDIQRDEKYEYHLIIDEQYHSERYIANEDSILLNVDLNDSCFTLAEWYQESDDISFSCIEPYKLITQVYCANSLMRDSSIVGIVEE